MINRQFLFLITILAILVLVVWNLFWPAFGNVTDVQRQLSTEQKKLKEVQELKQKLTVDWKKKYEALEKDIDKIMLALPTKDDIPGLLVQYEALTSQNGLILNALKFTPIASARGQAPMTEPEELPERQEPSTQFLNEASELPLASAATPKILAVSLELSGNYFALKNFLKAAENSLRLMDITSVTFSQGAQAVEQTPAQTISGLSSVNINLNLYYK